MHTPVLPAVISWWFALLYTIMLTWLVSQAQDDRRRSLCV
jgi:hypothetical protein